MQAKKPQKTAPVTHDQGAGWSLGISEEKCTVNIYKFLNGQCISGPVLAITWLANVIRLFPLMIMFQHDDYSRAEFWSQHVPDND